MDIEWSKLGSFGTHNHFIHEDVINHDVCDNILNFYDTCDYLEKKPGFIGMGDSPNSDKKVSWDLSIHQSLCDKDVRLQSYMAELDICVKNYFEKYQFALSDCAIFPMFNIQNYPPNGGYKVWHFERTNARLARDRHLVWMTFLTDNPDGGTEFLYQNLYIPAEKGKTLIWPAEWTHTHRGRPDTKYEKTIITGWIEFR